MLSRIAIAPLLLIMACTGADDAPPADPRADGALGTRPGEGSPGAAGAQGPAGPSGLRGADGADGADGASRIFGDGSAGALEIAKDTFFSDRNPADGNLAFTSIHIAAGARLFVPSGTVLRATGKVEIEGELVAAPGARSGEPASAFPLGIAMKSCEDARFLKNAIGTASNAGGVGLQGNLRDGLPSDGLGGAGGCGPFDASGGGRVTVVAGETLTVAKDAAIAANGVTKDNTMGGGGGGVIVLGAAKEIVVLGKVQAAGGGGGGHGSGTNGTDVYNTFGGGGGGGGGILCFAPIITAPLTVFDVAGGKAAPLPIRPATPAVWLGGGGGASVGDGGRGVTWDAALKAATPAEDGRSGAVVLAKTHPANSRYF